MIKIKPAVLNLPAKQKSGKNISKKLTEAMKETPKSKLDFSSEEDGYYKVGDRIINIIFPR